MRGKGKDLRDKRGDMLLGRFTNNRTEYQSLNVRGGRYGDALNKAVQAFCTCGGGWGGSDQMIRRVLKD